MMKMIHSFFKVLTIGGFSLCLAIIGSFFIYCAIILMWTKDSKTLESSDAIIVLTGGKDRIEAGFQLLLDDKAPQLLISGVIESATFQDIVRSRDLTQSEKNKILRHCCIELDYIADTTETNAIESAKWIEKNKVKKIILVTSASHMPRAYLQFNRALAKDVTIHPFPVRKETRSDLVQSKGFWLYAGREYIKYLGSWIRLERR